MDLRGRRRSRRRRTEVDIHVSRFLFNSPSVLFDSHTSDGLCDAWLWFNRWFMRKFFQNFHSFASVANDFFETKPITVQALAIMWKCFDIFTLQPYQGSFCHFRSVWCEWSLRNIFRKSRHKNISIIEVSAIEFRCSCCCWYIYMWTYYFACCHIFTVLLLLRPYPSHIHCCLFKCVCINVGLFTCAISPRH